MPGKYEANRNYNQTPPSRRPPYDGRTPPPRRRRRRRRRRRLNPSFVVLCAVALALLIALIAGCSHLLSGGEDPTGPSGETAATEGNKGGWFWNRGTEPPTEPPTEEPTTPAIASTATISATGDVLMHMPVVNSCYSSGSYDFTGIFQYLDDYTLAADYAVANLETTLAGTENGYPYSGYPCFNCPDAIVDGLKTSGFDMLLTANNHCYDTRTVGLTRTVTVVREKGLDTLGTHATAEDPKYIVKDLNGIQVGMLCYSYATADDYPDRASMNGILTATNAAGLINYFDYDRLDLFYADVEKYIDAMESAGAEAIVMYIHWGEEYQLKANSHQTAIAQGLCDLGIDVIVGGHPHVVQPMELLTSTTDPEHKTVCLYSMGNAISNQMRQNMNLQTGHTEDGVLFSFTFAEYTDGTVLLDSVDILPTWVRLDTSGSARTYRILPLDKDVADWGATYGIGSSAVSSAQSSYERTMELVSAGLTASNEYLTAQREAKLSADAQ